MQIPQEECNVIPINLMNTLKIKVDYFPQRKKERMDLDMVPALSLRYTVKGGNTYSVPGKCSEMLATIVVMLVMVKEGILIILF